MHRASATLEHILLLTPICWNKLKHWFFYLQLSRAFILYYSEVIIHLLLTFRRMMTRFYFISIRHYKHQQTFKLKIRSNCFTPNRFALCYTSSSSSVFLSSCLCEHLVFVSKKPIITTTCSSKFTMISDL